LLEDIALRRANNPHQSEGGSSLRGAGTRLGLAIVLGLFMVLSAAEVWAAPIGVNQPAPDFARTDLHKAQVHLGGYRGKIVLLDFWASWCAPCLLEMPRFVEWQDRYGKQRFQILGVSMDDDDSSALAVEKKMHLNYPVVMGDEKLGELYGGILGLPVVYLIDRDGVIRARFDGETDPHLIEVELNRLLAAR
jgi:peroxiredoxin